MNIRRFLSGLRLVSGAAPVMLAPKRRPTVGGAGSRRQRTRSNKLFGRKCRTAAEWKRRTAVIAENRINLAAWPA